MMLSKIRFCIILLLVLLGDLAAQESRPQSVKLYLGWKHQFQFAGYHVAVDQEFFSESDLEVELVQYDGSLAPDKVLSGDYEYGVATAAQLIAHPRREELLVVIPIFQQSPLSLVVHRRYGIEKLIDMEGLRVGSGDEIQAMMKVAGVDLSKVQFRKKTSFLSDLETGEYDAVTYYITDPIANPEDYQIFLPINYGINFYGECLYTTRKEYEENPERVDAMYRAVRKGWEFAIDKPDKTIEIIQRRFNRGLTDERLRTEASVVVSSLLQPSFYPVGFNDREKWIHMVRTIGDLESIESSLDLDAFIYNPELDVFSKSLDRFLKIAFIGGGCILVLVLGLLFYNRQLIKAVDNRTKNLELANQIIEENNEQLMTQKAELESLVQFKDKMLSVISHDIKGPMTSVKGLLEMASDGDLSQEKFREFTVTATSKIDEVSALFENLLFWYKNQISGEHLDQKRLDLISMIRESIETHSVVLEARRLKVNLDGPTESWVKADEESIKVVIRNLLSNAIKFSGDGSSIDITVSEGEEWATTSVLDYGPGIDDADKHLIFKPYMKSKTGYTGEKGTGLGLLLCKEFVEKNQGEIGVESDSGNGSKFWFKLQKA